MIVEYEKIYDYTRASMIFESLQDIYLAAD